MWQIFSATEVVFSINYTLLMPFAKPKARRSFAISPTMKGKNPIFKIYQIPTVEPPLKRLRYKTKMPEI